MKGVSKMLYKMMIKYFALSVTLFFSSSAQQISSVYDFPVKPGTEEWKALKTHKEMLAVCQIPENILKQMTTEALVQTCIDFPLFDDMFVYNNRQIGFSKVSLRFNGLKELLSRKDAGKYVMRKYYDFNPIDIKPEWSLLEKGKYAQKINRLEILLSQKEILSTLSHTEKNDLLSNAFKYYRSKQNNPMVYGKMDCEFNLLLLSRVATESNAEQTKIVFSTDEKIKRFIEGGNLIDGETVKKIITTVENVLTNQK